MQVLEEGPRADLCPLLTAQEGLDWNRKWGGQRQRLQRNALQQVACTTPFIMPLLVTAVNSGIQGD